MTSTLERCQKLWKQTSQSRPKFPSFASNRPAFTQVKELFARSSVSCLTGDELQGVTAEQGDPCWQVTQQLHLLIEKVRFPHRSATKRSAFSLGETASDAVSELGPPVDSINDWLSGPELCGLHWIRSSPTHWSLELTHPHTHTHCSQQMTQQHYLTFITTNKNVALPETQQGQYAAWRCFSPDSATDYKTNKVLQICF